MSSGGKAVAMQSFASVTQAAKFVVRMPALARSGDLLMTQSQRVVPKMGAC
jgi:hypothetical protein